MMLRQAEQAGKISWIKIPNSIQTQLSSLFADNTAISLEVSRLQTIKNLIDLLNLYKEASGMEIKWSKSHAYSCVHAAKPPWLDGIGWQWALEKDLSKLLGTPFGLNLDSDNIDNFLLNRICGKLSYLCSTKLSLAGRAMVIKQVLLLSLWFFLSIWCTTMKVMHKIKALLRNFLWSGKDHSTRTRVNWHDCCAKKQVGGLNLIDPQEATTSLLCKWVVAAYQPGNSNLQVMLRNKLWTSSPVKNAKWPDEAQWGLIWNHAPIPGSKAWEKVQMAWKKMSRHIRDAPPICNADACQVPL